MSQLLVSPPLVPLETNSRFILFSVSEPHLVCFFSLTATRKNFWQKSGALKYFHVQICQMLTKLLSSQLLPSTANSYYSQQLYKAAVDFELVNTEPLLPGDIQGQVPESLWSHCHQPISTQVFMCVSIYKNFIYQMLLIHQPWTYGHNTIIHA